MKKFFKALFTIILIIIIVVVGYLGYIYFSKGGERNAFSVIPDDAIFIIETSNLNEGWEALSESKMWKHLIANPYFSDINKDANSADSLLKGNKAIDILLSNRQLLVSAHMISGIDYDFIFVIDVQKASKFSFLTKILKFFDYTVNKRNYEDTEIIELTDNETNEILYLSIIDNLLVGTYSGVLMENTIQQKDNGFWGNNTKFQQVADEISSRKLFNFYFNYSMLAKYLKCYLSEESEIANSLSDAISYSAFNIELENERLSFNGYTNIHDSISSYIKALSKVNPGRMRAHEIISDRAALFLSMCFDDYNNFYNNLEKELSYDSKNYEDFNQGINKVEKLLKINLQKIFFSWIGNEIAFVKLQPTINSREEDIVVAIHTKGISDANTGLTILMEQVKKRTPAKFETINHKNHEINYLDIKGFFKMFLGNLFEKLEKPYFTFIEDYVVFSNSPSTLIDIIDDYVKGKTLSHKESFMDFKDEFNNKANVTIFVQMPKIYSHLYHNSNSETRKDIQNNKDMILSFARIGFQLISDGKMLKTILIAEHDESILFDEELEKLKNSADELFSSEIDPLTFKIILSEEKLSKDGPCKAYYPDSSIKLEGTITDGEINGLWRAYYKSGNIMNSVNYEKGKTDGTVIFYYDNDKQIKKAEFNFKDDIIVDIYREYYENGARKAKLNYDDGKPDGDAEFYYDTGILKMQGRYKDGIRKGKWKYYTETGELYSREKWKKQ